VRGRRNATIAIAVASAVHTNIDFEADQTRFAAEAEGFRLYSERPGARSRNQPAPVDVGRGVRNWVVGAVVAVVCVGCGSGVARELTPTPSTANVRGAYVAPVLIVRAGSSRVEVAPTRWSEFTAKRSFSADGTRPVHPVDVGPGAEVLIEFDEPGWTFVANLQSVEGGSVFTRQLRSVDHTGYRLDPIGRAGVFDVSFFGQGSTGAVEIWVRWTATA